MSPDTDAANLQAASDPSVPPPLAARSGKRWNRWVNVALVLALAVFVAGGSFAAGRLTAPSRRGFGGSQGGGLGGGFQGGGVGGDGAPGASPGAGFRGGFGSSALQGAVVSMTADQLTIKLSSGQTINIPLTGTTTYHSQVPATADQVKTGSQVLVRLQAPTVGGGAPATGQLPAASEITVITP